MSWTKRGLSARRKPPRDARRCCDHTAARTQATNLRHRLRRRGSGSGSNVQRRYVEAIKTMNLIRALLDDEREVAARVILDRLSADTNISTHIENEIARRATGQETKLHRS